jgi:hypothetical protein
MSRSDMNISSTSKFHRLWPRLANLAPLNLRQAEQDHDTEVCDQQEMWMAKIPDPLGGKDKASEYQLRGRPKANKSRAKSIAGVIVTVILDVLAGLTILLRSNPETDPAPRGAPGTGISRQPSPTNSQP